MIASTANSRVKYVRRLQADRRFREREGCFVVEGTRWLQEVVAQQVSPVHLFATPAWLDAQESGPLLGPLEEVVQPVSEAVMAHMSDTQHPAGVLAVLPRPDHPLPAHPRLLLVIDRLNDPGNLGTIIRTAAAAGVDALLLAPGTVDPTNPKVVRATMGALLRLPIATPAWTAIAEAVAGTAIWLAAAGEGLPYFEVDWSRPTTLIIGNEAHGPGAEARRLASGQVTIPLAPGSESLNAAVAAGILLFAAAERGNGR